MKPIVIVYKPLPADLLQRLTDHFTVTQLDGLTEANIEKYEAVLRTAEGMIGSGYNINDEFLKKIPKLRAAATVSAGFNQFDVDALTRRGVLLLNTPDALTDTVADVMMLLVLATARRAVEVANYIKQGNWQGSIKDELFGIDVHHKTLGIIGMGRIGMALAQRAHFGFSMPILYNARRHHSEAQLRVNARYCELDTLLAEADFVCITLPLTDETYHLIGEAQLAKMKPSAILVNAGRGPVVDEQALIAALQTGKIRGAGLDVFEQEPLPVNSPLLSLANVVALPHIGSATHETRYKMAACAVDNLIAALTGKPLQNMVNPQVLK